MQKISRFSKIFTSFQLNTAMFCNEKYINFTVYLKNCPLSKNC